MKNLTVELPSELVELLGSEEQANLDATPRSRSCSTLFGEGASPARALPNCWA